MAMMTTVLTNCINRVPAIRPSIDDVAIVVWKSTKRRRKGSFLAAFLCLDAAGTIVSCGFWFIKEVNEHDDPFIFYHDYDRAKTMDARRAGKRPCDPASRRGNGRPQMFVISAILREKGDWHNGDEKSIDDVVGGNGRFHLTRRGMAMMLRVLLLSIEFHKLFKTALRILFRSGVK